MLHLTRPVNERTKGFKTVVTVDEIRRVNRFLSMTAHDGGWRVVIIDPADDMNINAANALLKNLEEPPAKTVFRFNHPFTWRFAADHSFAKPDDPTVAVVRC